MRGSRERHASRGISSSGAHKRSTDRGSNPQDAILHRNARSRLEADLCLEREELRRNRVHDDVVLVRRGLVAAETGAVATERHTCEVSKDGAAGEHG
jgi:hypothetical protein